jgi:DNA polymerase-3 subunit epsilon
LFINETSDDARKLQQVDLRSSRQELASYVLEQAIEQLKLSEKYRIIEKYEKPIAYSIDDGSHKFKGIFLDVETTGLLIPEDKIIELGLVVFEYAENGRIFRILEEFSQYQDPLKPIPAEIVALTGISNEIVKGQKLDKKTIFVTARSLIKQILQQAPSE